VSHILHLDASPRGALSHSRRISAEFMAVWKAAHPEDTVTYRDLGHEPVPNVTEDWIAAVYSPPGSHTPEQASAIAVSDELVQELFDADTFVFGVPMYNFGVPASFKAYVDQVVRPGRTVHFEPNAAPRGGLTGKKLVVLTSRGLSGYGPGEAAEAVNYQDPYIRAIFGFIGVTDVTFIHNNDTLGGAVPGASVEKVRSEIWHVVAGAHAA
jgi:FMN-dependent NADH-azoreductase